MDNFNLLKTLMLRNRSIRRFDNSRRLAPDTLRELVGLTRLCASGRNLQPLKYRIAYTESECADIYPALAWAGYYKDWNGPEPRQRPVAYLVQCLDTSLTENPMCDEGLQLEALTLGATAMGLGACIIKAFDAKAVASALSIPEHLRPEYVVALGYPAEEALIVDLPADGDYRYFRDDKDRQCVPKRPIDQLIVE